MEGLNTALRIQLLGTADLADWEPTGLDFAEGVMTGTTATVLMLLGLVLWLAALAHLVVMLGRAVSLIVIAATAPIAVTVGGCTDRDYLVYQPPPAEQALIDEYERCPP